ncbi:hypothetical protein Taro_034050 [Colocasia esculenta]|uniref:RRM domain-containing protein n=1 Tax=Colocasia esculenta TaxID=4460 RepID=A0A843VQB1_COLES|nr:hypothetical protein [Colocasia esculenta]
MVASRQALRHDPYLVNTSYRVIYSPVGLRAHSSAKPAFSHLRSRPLVLPISPAFTSLLPINTLTSPPAPSAERRRGIELRSREKRGAIDHRGMVANMGQQFGDTTLTKVFVGGLAWETQKETLREHFDKYGEILEAVIIFDKATGRSKGYGFVTFKEAEAAKKACEDATPLINGRRANCNLASLGARRLRVSPTAAPAQHQPGIAVPASRVVTTPPPPPASAGGPMYYPYGAPQPSPFQHPYHGAVPFYVAYGYTPSYLTDVGYSRQKVSHGAGGGAYIAGQFPPASYPAQAGLVSPNGLLPVYPYYQWHQQSQAVGVHPHVFAPATAGPVTTIPTIVSKPAPAMPPTAESDLIELQKSL